MCQHLNLFHLPHKLCKNSFFTHISCWKKQGYWHMRVRRKHFEVEMFTSPLFTWKKQAGFFFRLRRKSMTKHCHTEPTQLAARAESPLSTAAQVERCIRWSGMWWPAAQFLHDSNLLKGRAGASWLISHRPLATCFCHRRHGFLSLTAWGRSSTEWNKSPRRGVNVNLWAQVLYVFVDAMDFFFFSLKNKISSFTISKCYSPSLRSFGLEWKPNYYNLWLNQLSILLA